MKSMPRACKRCRRVKAPKRFRRLWVCIVCDRKYHAEWNRSRGRECVRRASLKKKYGITLEFYALMLANQGGNCAICLKPESEKIRNGSPKPLSVDHDHATGRVRGLLCCRCNRSITMFDHSPELVPRAIAYLAGGDS